MKGLSFTMKKMYWIFLLTMWVIVEKVFWLRFIRLFPVQRSVCISICFQINFKLQKCWLLVLGCLFNWRHGTAITVSAPKLIWSYLFLQKMNTKILGLKNIVMGRRTWCHKTPPTSEDSAQHIIAFAICIRLQCC